MMKEYTLLGIISVGVAILLDRRLATRLLSQGAFYLFLGVIFLAKLLVNGYLTGNNIVQYGPRFYSGVRIGTIPVEDFLFGFSMVTVTIVLWEYGKRKEEGKGR